MRKNALILVLCIAVVGMAAYAVRQNRQIRAMRQDYASGEHAVKKVVVASAAVAGEPPQGSPDQGTQEIAEERRRLQKEIHQLEAQLEDAEAELDNPPDEPAVGDTQTPKPPSKSPMAGLAEMMKKPEMKEMMRGQQRIALDVTYGALFSEMELSPDELGEFKELLVDKQMAFLDISTGMMGGATSADEMAEQSKTVKAITEEYNDRIRSEIGEEYYELLTAYEKSLPDRVQVNQFKTILSTDDRLTGEQEEELVAAMYEERTNLYSSLKDEQEQPFDPRKITREALDEKLDELAELQENYIEVARNILTESQLAQFTKSSEQMRAMQEMGIRMSMEMLAKPEEEDDADKTTE